MKNRIVITIVIVMMTVFTIGGFALITPNVYASSNYKVTKNGVTIYTASGERLKTCQRMYDMSSVKWTVSKNISYKYMSGKTTTLEKGTYRGLPYTQVDRDYSRPDKIQGYMDDVVYNSGSVKGVDCSSAAAYALRYGTGNNNSSSNYMKGRSSAYVGSSYLYDATRAKSGTATTVGGADIKYGNYLSIVGWYGNYTGYASATTTKGVLNKLTSSGNYNFGTVYENVYAKMRPGDILVRYYLNNSGKAVGHVMLVSKVELVYNGKYIDSDKSKVYVIDQISPDRSTYPDGCISSWRNDNTGNNCFSFKSIVDSYTIPVTAWKMTSTYTITYNSNGGSLTPGSQYKGQYAPIKLRTAVPLKKGYSFRYWQAVSDPAGTTYSPGSYYLEERSDTLKAIWKANTATIKYNANGGTEAPTSQTKIYGINLKLNNEKPVRAGFEFMGWSTSKNSSQAEYSAGAIYSDDSALSAETGSVITLYAVWKNDISGADIKLSKEKALYTGNEIKPEIIVKYNGKKLSKGIDYLINYPADMSRVMRYSILITGMGEYAGAEYVYFTILPRAPETVDADLFGHDDIKLNWTESYGASGYNIYYKLSTASKYKYYGDTTETSIEIYNLTDGKKYYFRIKPYLLSETKHLSTEYKTDNVYTLKKISTPVVSRSISKVKVKWKNISGESGYEISRSKSKTGTNIVATLKTTTGTYKKISATKGIKYYYKVRAYKIVNDEMIYGPWSNVKAYKR